MSLSSSLAAILFLMLMIQHGNKYQSTAICHEAVFTAESEEISDLNTFLKEQNQKLYDAGIESLLSGIQSQLDAQKD